MSDGVIKVLFRLDYGGPFGLGHLIRSKALADALLKVKLANKKIESTFAIKTVYAADVVNPHQLLFIDTEEEFILIAGSYDIIIIDHYDYTSGLFLQLSKIKSSILVVLDDECNRGDLYADVIVNSAINPAAGTFTLNYKKAAAKAKLLLGSKYVLLRQIFNQNEIQPFKQRDSIIITFGGSDITGLTLPVLKRLIHSSLINSKIIVVTAAGYQNCEEIKQYCLQQHFIYKHSVENMAELFLTAKFAISAAGSTIFELACCGVPAVFAVVADNQLLSAKEQSQHGWCSVIDCRNENKVDGLILSAEKMINECSLKKMSNKARLLFDARGADRVASAILARLFLLEI